MAIAVHATAVFASSANKAAGCKSRVRDRSVGHSRLYDSVCENSVHETRDHDGSVGESSVCILRSRDQRALEQRL